MPFGLSRTSIGTELPRPDARGPVRTERAKRSGPIRVLHVLGRLNVGGAEMRTLEVMRRLDPGEFQLEFCVLTGRAGPLDAEVQRLGGAVHPVALNVSFPTRFCRLLRTGHYDVVHSHVHLTSGLILWLAARCLTKGRIAHLRSTHDGRPDGIRRRLQRATMTALIQRYATDIVGVCEGVLDCSLGTDWREDLRCTVIYNGVDLSRFEAAVDRKAVRAEFGITPGATLYLHVGRISPPKNHGRLLAIFSVIRSQTPSAKLLLVGAGPNERSLLSLIGSMGLADSVILAGAREDVPVLLRSAEVLLLPSLREGLPGVVLEACAVGLPVLASDLPGVCEIAARLPLVRVLPLAASDATWATTARELSTRPEWLQHRDRAPDVFGRSVFQIDRAVEAHSALWRRAAGNALQFEQ